jgi:hypothetical protein
LLNYSAAGGRAVNEVTGLWRILLDFLVVNPLDEVPCQRVFLGVAAAEPCASLQ